MLLGQGFFVVAMAITFMVVPISTSSYQQFSASRCSRLATSASKAFLGLPETDDVVTFWYFKLHVGIIGYRHEFDEGWVPKEGVVAPLEGHHLKAKRFGPEVFLGSGDDLLADLAKWLLFLGHDSVEVCW